MTLKKFKALHRAATLKGLERARAAGKKLGRPRKAEALLKRAEGLMRQEGLSLETAVERVNRAGGEQISKTSLWRYVKRQAGSPT